MIRQSRLSTRASVTTCAQNHLRRYASHKNTFLLQFRADYHFCGAACASSRICDGRLTLCSETAEEGPVHSAIVYNTSSNFKNKTLTDNASRVFKVSCGGSSSIYLQVLLLPQQICHMSDERQKSQRGSIPNLYAKPYSIFTYSA